MMRERPRKVLVIDDDEGAREFVTAIMQAEGWVVVEGINGQEALELAEEETPDLIIMDVSMPVMNGFEAFARLRSNYFTKDIPVVMLTAINEVEPGFGYDEEKMEKFLGVPRPEGFVDKPVNSMFLLDTVFGVVGHGRI